MILFPEFLFYVSSETSDREEDVIAYMWIQLKWCDQCQLRRWTASSLLLLLILSFTSLATGMTLNILPLALIAHKQMENQKVELASLRRYWSSVILFGTSSSWSYTPHIHRSLPVDDGKRNPHPPTYTGILVAPGSTEPWSSYQKGWAIQNCIPSVLRQEAWIATPSRPTARWFISCKVRSTERREDVWKRHCEKPYSPVTMSSRHLNFGVVRKNVQRSVLVELRWLMNKIWT